jgi:hypothetical protein
MPSRFSKAFSKAGALGGTSTDAGTFNDPRPIFGKIHGGILWVLLSTLM